MKRILLTTLCILASSSFAHAGGSTGGGNTDEKGNLIEDYIVDDPSTIRGYSNFREQLEKVRQKLPALATVMEQHLGKMDWYSIPADIEELPSETTKLYFHTNQPVYQTANEVFTSEKKLAKVPEEKIGRTFIHEGVMSLQKDKDAVKVRPVVARLLSEKVSLGEVQDVLARNDFGGYLTARELDILASVQGPKLLAWQEADIETLTSWCGVRLKGSFDGERKKIEELENSKKYGFRFVGTEADLIQTVEEETPFSLTARCGGVDANFNYSMCRALSSPPKYGEPNFELSQEVYLAHAREMNKRLLAAKIEKMKALAGSEAYITLLAIQSRFNAEGDLVLLKYPKNPSPEAVDLARKIMAKVKARRAAIDFNDRDSLGRLHCNSIFAVQKEIKRLAAPASDPTAAPGAENAVGAKPESTDAN